MCSVGKADRNGPRWSMTSLSPLMSRMKLAATIARTKPITIRAKFFLYENSYWRRSQIPISRLAMAMTGPHQEKWERSSSILYSANLPPPRNDSFMKLSRKTDAKIDMTNPTNVASDPSTKYQRGRILMCSVWIRSMTCLVMSFSGSDINVSLRFLLD